MEQRTPEWFAARLGKVTASRVKDILAKTKTGYSTSRANYMFELICERLTGNHEDIFISAPMQRGMDLEDAAKANYMIENGEMVHNVGFVDHPHIKNFGASPDGMVGDDGLIEIKCPNTATHISTLKSRKPKSEYITQMQVQMACTGRKWCDFVSYDDRLPDNLAFVCIRIDRDDDYIAEIEREVSAFLKELDAELVELNELAAA